MKTINFATEADVSDICSLRNIREIVNNYLALCSCVVILLLFFLVFFVVDFYMLINHLKKQKNIFI